jgi:hypothetical protein
MCEQEIILHKIAKVIAELWLKDNKHLIRLFLEKNYNFSFFIMQLVNMIKEQENRSRKIEKILSSGKINFEVLTEITGLDRIVTVSVSINSFSRTRLKLLDRFFISQKMFKKLNLKYIGNHEFFEKELYKLLYRYSTLWQYQSFLAEENLLLFKEELECSLECFSCPLYRVYDNYCSMFEEDKVFGSFGDFFKFQLVRDYEIKNQYLPMLEGPTSEGAKTIELCMELNPPYISEIVDKTIDKIIELITVDGAFCFILTIPDWFLDKIPKLYEKGLSIIEIHPERINFTLYTKHFQKINYYKTSVTILIIRNKKGELRYPVTETFIQRLIDINKTTSTSH